MTRTIIFVAILCSSLSAGALPASAQSNTERAVPKYFLDFLMRWSIAQEIANKCPDVRILRNRWRGQAVKIEEKLRFDNFTYYQTRQMMQNPNKELVDARWRAYLEHRKFDIRTAEGACQLAAIEQKEKTPIGKLLYAK